MSWKSGNRDDEPLLVPQKEKKRALAGLQTAPAMEIAGQAAVPASPPGPGYDQLHTAGSRPDQASKQMAHFGNREREQGSGIGGRLTSRGDWSCQRRASQRDVLGTDPGKVRMGQHHQRDMAIP